LLEDVGHGPIARGPCLRQAGLASLGMTNKQRPAHGHSAKVIANNEEHRSGRATQAALFAGRGYRFVLFEFSFAGYGGDDLAAVEAAVFDENFGGLQAAYDYAC
jgi:hypothetical protein